MTVTAIMAGLLPILRRSGATIAYEALLPCFIGQRSEPYEQNTQQSPGVGRSSVWHPLHSWKKVQASVGMRHVSSNSQTGHRIVQSRIGGVISAGPRSIPRGSHRAS